MKILKPSPHGSNAIKGAISRATVLPPLSKNRTSEITNLITNWNNDWPHWDHSYKHNQWENTNPNPPGGK